MSEHGRVCKAASRQDLWNNVYWTDKNKVEMFGRIAVWYMKKTTKIINDK